MDDLSAARLTHTNRATGQDQEDVALLEFLDSIFSAQWDKKRSSSRRSRSSGSNSDGAGGRSSDHEPWQHPAVFVKSGERLDNVLLSPDQTSGLFADPEDASLRFYRHVAPGTSVDDAATGGKGTLTTLLPSDPRMLKRAREIRREINDEDAGKEGENPLARRIQGYWPWGKHGLLRARQRENARMYREGEVWIALSKRGVLVRTLFPRRQACDG